MESRVFEKNKPSFFDEKNANSIDKLDRGRRKGK